MKRTTGSEPIKIHDLILGDFGRTGTIRYFQAFSEAEQGLLQEAQDNSFYDECRMVRYTIVGVLRDIKQNFLPEYLSEIDDSVLIGVNGGPSPLDIMPDVLRVLSPYIVQASRNGATTIRIIIPCNTLYDLSKKLQKVLETEDSFSAYLEKHDISGRWADELLFIIRRNTTIIVPSVAEIVVDRINDDNINTVLVSASKAAEFAYKDVITKQHENLEFQSWLPPGVSDFGQLLKKTIRGEEIDLGTQDEKDDTTIVSGCTDIELPFGEDSAKRFAEEMAEEAYKALDVID